MTIDHAPIGIALVSPDGRWLRVNKALCEMTGYTEGELLARTFQGITHPDDLDAQLEYVRQMLAGELATYELEKRLLCADGQVLWIGLSVSLVRDRDGAPLHFVSQMQDIGQRKRDERELRQLAEHDALTGLANRRVLGRDITRQLTHQARYGGQLALLIVDLDHFKYINDTLGHRVGDQVIRAVAEALRTRLRESDTVARLGGDEFAILLPQTNRDAAQQVAQELVETLAALQITDPRARVAGVRVDRDRGRRRTRAGQRGRPARRRRPRDVRRQGRRPRPLRDPRRRRRQPKPRERPAELVLPHPPGACRTICSSSTTSRSSTSPTARSATTKR